MNSRTFQWLSVAVMVVIGLLHLYMAPQEYGETPYMGILFGLNFIAAIIAGVGIYQRENWGWLLGVAIAAGSLLGYILSRTIALPGMEIEAWLQPLGLFSLVVETFFILMAARQKPWQGILAKTH
jgi:hypothetical protein